MSETRQYARTLILFDVDGTLTPARQKITSKVEAVLGKLRKLAYIGFVGGSDLNKQFEQLGDDAISKFDYCFAENGLTAFKNGKELSTQSFINFIGESEYQKLVNFILLYISELDIPKKRGTFVEFRNGMINVSPIGRNCSKEEREEFEKHDKVAKIREQFVKELKSKFGHLKLKFSIGGQISFDVFPEGWDKTYCLRHVPEADFDEIYFFGDKTFEGGNDYEIFTSDRITGHSVTSPDETIAKLQKIFDINEVE